jgi:hypothetical protein
MASETLVGYANLQKRFAAIGGGKIPKPLLNATALAVVREQKLLASRFRKTGNLERGIVIREVTETHAVIESNAAYSGFVEGGTGLYGPLHRKITPQAAKALRWVGGGPSKVRLSGSSRTKGGVAQAQFLYAMSVKGRPATPYFFPGAKAGLAKAGADGIAAIVTAWNGAA